MALLAVAVASGCGDDGDDAGPVPISGPAPATVYRQAAAAFAQRDHEALCTTLSANAKSVIARAGHGPALSCALDIRRVRQWFKGDRGKPEITSVTKSGTSSTIGLRLKDGTELELPLTATRGRWKLDGLFDATVSRIQVRSTPAEARYMEKAVIPRLRPAPRATPPATVAARGGGPCPAIDLDEFPEVTGGCLLEADGEHVDVSVRTAFGTIEFARCGLSFDLHVTGDGSGWIVDPTVDGGNPCFDAMPCLDRSNDKIPWRGRIVRRAGGLRVQLLDVCLDTCLGRFVGDIDLGLRKSPRGWLLRAEAMIGKAGWTFDGILRSRAALTIE